MGESGSIIVYVIIWWIVFSLLPVGIRSIMQNLMIRLLEDPGAPKNLILEKSLFIRL